MNSVINSQLVSPFSKGRQHQLKFQAILSEAAQLFNWQGSRATTLADIAGSMQLTKTCVYYYVKTKEDLIYQCYVSSCAMWLDHVQAANQLQGNGIEKIISLVKRHFYQYIDTLQGVGPHYALLSEISALDAEHAEDIMQRWSNIFADCQQMVEQGIDEGLIEDLDPAVIVTGIFSILQWFPVWLNRSHGANPEPVIEGVLDILVNGLSAQKHQFVDIQFPQLSGLQLDSFDREYQSHIKREAFYRVGAIYFNQKGYKGTSLDEIANSLDVTKGAFYYHIKNKEELLYQCFNRSLDVESRLLNKAGASQANGLKKIELSLRYLFNIQFSEQGPLIRYRALPSLDEQHRKAVLKANKNNSKILGTYIDQGFADGTLRPMDVDIAQNVLSGAVEASPELANWIADIRSPEVSAAYFNLFINGLARRSA
ncbi:TetR/AcrR family transcriptional regulator [Porticoccaceae bacterium]|jgi:AcrR family transcriptional regulator|nr:TetR/AcrR family transcriptional regulator [Porticoccaceae bacterium]MDA8978842.1 TetR/AcrR family transcriptional regulator [bacterium]MBT7258176.1 TetR/AcrR family transcriptional regulator [Porticoccaceae bacterium]MDA7767330.1 TetR/AcrR family transcriptional regulator [Porticoccaceae bacterium]MDB2480978.1 TetR/AcrR family transcriptional regulator [Porticoccaceae bacterium]